jgi:hypothetical protein
MNFDLAGELVRLASLGYAPIILYDDNGNWAVSDEGCSNIRVDDNDDFSITIYGEAAWFRDTPQAAWEYYLVRLRELGNDV